MNTGFFGLLSTNRARGSSGSAPAGAAYSDNFNRADGTDIGANYTELSPGGWTILSNQLNNDTGGFTWVGTVNSQQTNTANQYGKITINNGGGSNNAGFIFRYTNSSSAFYEVLIYPISDLIIWRHWTAVGGTVTTVGSTAYTPGSFPLTIGITLSGTGTSTEVKVWINPTGLPDWGTADYTLTNDPASAVDSGTIMGISGLSNSSVLVDNWYWGDL